MGLHLFFWIAMACAIIDAIAADPWHHHHDYGRSGKKKGGKGGNAKNYWHHQKKKNYWHHQKKKKVYKGGKGYYGKGKGHYHTGIPDDLPTCNGCHCIREPDPGSGYCPKLPRTDYSHIIPLLKMQVPKSDSSKYEGIIDANGDPCNPYDPTKTCITAPAQQNLALVADPDNAVCGIKYDWGYFRTGCSQYELESYPSVYAAKRDGAYITHTGACGVCSSPSDLAIFMERAQTLDNDVPFMCVIPNLPLPLGTPPTAEDVANMIGCANQVLGLSLGCSQIWIFSSLNTFNSCFEECQPVVESNGTIPNIDSVTCELNDCLACDEENTQEIFRNFAARTRRRSNIISSTPRLCSELPPITHRKCSTAYHGHYYYW